MTQFRIKLIINLSSKQISIICYFRFMINPNHLGIKEKPPNQYDTFVGLPFIDMKSF